MNMKKILYAIGVVTAFIIYSCQKYDNPVVQTSATYPISGEWWVTLKDTGGHVLVNYTKLLTYNTSSNTPDSVWVDDQGNIWDFKVKAACNVKVKTFAVDSTLNQYYPINVAIKNGKVILKGGVTKGGNVSDSIYMQIGFTDGGGETYVISGVRRTGFKADEY
jgi:hypothetical protein